MGDSDRLDHLKPAPFPMPPRLETLSVIERKHGVLAELRSRIDMLKQEEKRMKQEILVHQASIAHIRKIPVELLSRIFTFIDPPVENRCEHYIPNPLDTNYLLMLVCKLWCRVAIRTPRLWHHLTLLPRSRTLEFLDTCVTRSGCLPLHVILHFDGMPSKFALWAKFTPLLKRLGSIHLRADADLEGVFDDHVWREFFKDIAKSPATDLILSSVEFEIVDLAKSCLMPNIRHLRIDGTIGSLPPLTLPNLETLRIVGCGVSPHTLRSILTTTAKLQTLDLKESWLEEYSWKPFRGDNTSASTLNELKVLKFGRNRGESDREFYLALIKHSPNLKNLHLTFSERAYDFIEQLPTSHFKQLTSLSIHAHRVDTCQWAEEVSHVLVEGVRPLMNWFAVADGLEELVVNSSEYSTDFDVGVILQSLIRGDEPNARMVCPRLRSLKVQGTTNWPSLILRIMVERAASAEDLKATGYNSDLASCLSQPFESEFYLTPNGTGTSGIWSYNSTSVGWKQFYEGYKECFGGADRMSPEQDHFDLTTITRHGDALQRLTFLCQKINDRVDAFRDQNNWQDEDEDDGGFTDPEFWYMNQGYSDDEDLYGDLYGDPYGDGDYW